MSDSSADFDEPSGTGRGPVGPLLIACLLTLLGVLLGILLLVIASNVWLRRRAEREESAGQDDAI